MNRQTIPFECWAILAMTKNPRIVHIDGQLAVYDNEPGALFKLANILEANPGKQNTYKVKSVTVTLEFRDE